MNTSPFVVLTSIAALLSAAAGGMMYVFSTMVMSGLARTGPGGAITAMRGINAQANASPAFLLPFFGATILALAVGVLAALHLRQPGNWWVLAGATFAVLGAIITMAFNVPLNDHLDAVDPIGLSAGEAAREWHAFVATWTAWNHARSATSLIGAALMLVGLRYR